MSSESSFLLNKARKYCAATERCVADVKQKLQRWQVEESTIYKIISQLEREDFINEERYAVAFAVGKLRHNKWGRNKIIYALQRKNIPELYIQIAIASIDDEEHLETLKKVLLSKKIDEDNPWIRNNKLVQYAVQKGFPADLSWKVLKGDV